MFFSLMIWLNSKVGLYKDDCLKRVIPLLWKRQSCFWPGALVSMKRWNMLNVRQLDIWWLVAQPEVKIYFQCWCNNMFFTVAHRRKKWPSWFFKSIWEKGVDLWNPKSILSGNYCKHWNNLPTMEAVIVRDFRPLYWLTSNILPVWFKSTLCKCVNLLLAYFWCRIVSQFKVG